VLLSHSFNGLLDDLVRLTLTGTIIATAVQAHHSTSPALAKRLGFDHPLCQLTAIGRPYRSGGPSLFLEGLLDNFVLKTQFGVHPRGRPRSSSDGSPPRGVRFEVLQSFYVGHLHTTVLAFPIVEKWLH